MRIPLRDLFDLVLVCNYNGVKKRAKNKGFLGTVITFSCILCLPFKKTAIDKELLTVIDFSTKHYDYLYFI